MLIVSFLISEDYLLDTFIWEVNTKYVETMILILFIHFHPSFVSV